jgi:hypothetical protein
VSRELGVTLLRSQHPQRLGRDSYPLPPCLEAGAPTTSELHQRQTHPILPG